MRRLVLSVLSLAFLVACQPATTELTEEQKAALADSVAALHIEMLQMWESADLERVMPYFLDSPDVGWGLFGEIRYGHDTVTSWFRPMLDGVTSAPFVVADRRVDVLGQHVVCVRESGTYSKAYTTGETRQPNPFAMTTIWVRRDGGWKIIHGHESFPPPESNG